VSFWLVEASVRTISSTRLQIKPLQAKPIRLLHTMLLEHSVKVFHRQMSSFRRHIWVLCSGQDDLSGPVLPLPCLLLAIRLVGKSNMSGPSFLLLLQLPVGVWILSAD